MDFGLEKEYSLELSKIRQLAYNLRSLRPSIETSWEEPVDWELKWSNIDGVPAKSLTITLTPSGCSWAKSGGCTMCGEYEGSAKGELITPMYHIAQFSSAASKYVAKFKPDWIRIYQEGNYVNSKELDENAQTIILRNASLFKGVKRITIEAMAKFINSENIRMLKEAVGDDVQLEIGMGFESQNDVIRNVCINKGESIGDYENAINILRENKIRSLAYVILKPPFLTEREAIQDSIDTVLKANEMGFNSVSLQPLTIHKYSLAHALYSINEYELPWLWSIIEVAKNVCNIDDFRIGGLGFYPRPINAAYNRHLVGDDCNPVLWKALKEYGRTRSIAVFDGIDCGCKDLWKSACDYEDVELHERINKKLTKINIEEYDKKFNNPSPLFPNMISIAGDTISAAKSYDSLIGQEKQ